MEAVFHFSSDAWNHNNVRLTNQIFKLLPMYENGEDWDKQLSTIIMDLYGYNDLFVDNPYFMTLIAKLRALRHVDDRVSFRKLVFEALCVLKEITI